MSENAPIKVGEKTPAYATYRGKDYSDGANDKRYRFKVAQDAERHDAGCRNQGRRVHE